MNKMDFSKFLKLIERYLPKITSVTQSPINLKEGHSNELPLVSVIIPNFNYDHFLKGCIQSVLASSLQNIEVILVDSSIEIDRSEKMQTLLENLVDDPRLRIFYRSPKKLGDNRNFGIEQARSKYVCSVDPDDLLHPNFLLILLFKLLNSELDVSGAGMHSFGLINELWHVKSCVNYLNLNIRNELASNSMFRKETWIKLGGFVDSNGNPHIHEDWRFWHRLAKSGGKIENIDFPLSMIRVHGKNMSWQPDVVPPKVQIEFIRSFNKDIRLNFAALRRCFFKKENVISSSSRNVYSLFKNLSNLDPNSDQFKMVRSLEELDLNSHQATSFILDFRETELQSAPSYSSAHLVHMKSLLNEKEWKSFITYLQIYCNPDTIVLLNDAKENLSIQDLDVR